MGRLSISGATLFCLNAIALEVKRCDEYPAKPGHHKRKAQQVRVTNTSARLLWARQPTGAECDSCK